MRKAPGRLLCPIYARASEGIRGGGGGGRQGFGEKNLMKGETKRGGEVTGRKLYTYIALPVV